LVVRDSRDIQKKVHDRLHAKHDGRVTRGHESFTCHSFPLDTVVWETLALLGEWDLISMEAKNEAARLRLGEG
jgi:hypothetical protein